MPDVLDSRFLLYLIAPFAFVALLAYHSRRKTPGWTVVLQALLLFYGLAVIGMTLFPLILAKDMIMEQQQFAQLSNNFMPFASIIGILQDGRSYVILPQIGGNILLAMPLGFLLPLLWQQFETFKKALTIGMLFSLAIETSQFVISWLYGFTYRITDVDDLLLNTVGLVIGWLLFKAAKPLLDLLLPAVHRKPQFERKAAV